MIRRGWHFSFELPFALLLVASPLFSQDARLSTSHHQAGEGPSASMFQLASERTGVLIERIRTCSYPELQTTQIQARPFKSASDFFRVRPRIPDFFMKKNLRYVILANPRAYELKVPEDGVEAVIAHELSHVAYLKKRNRLRLLTMVRLLSKSCAANFENGPGCNFPRIRRRSQGVSPLALPAHLSKKSGRKATELSFFGGN